MDRRSRLAVACHLLVVSLIVGTLTVSGRAAWARQTMSLDGDWECAFADAAAPPSPIAEWQPIRVPSVLSWRPEGPHCLWYRRSFTVPAEWRGQRIVLRLAGVKYTHAAFVNGERVGEHMGGYEPTEYDVTTRVRLGARNELMVAAQDWTSLVVPDALVLPPDRAAEFPSWIKNGILAPIGSRGSEVGIWQSVSLEARPWVWVKDVFVIPSVRKGKLCVQVSVRNDSSQEAGVPVAAEVTGGGSGPRLTAQRVALPPGAEQAINLEADWPDAELWWPESPHLYTLTVRAGQDTVTARFGFREFWVEGYQLVLNGRPINFLATAAHPMAEYDDDPKRAYAIARGAGCVAMRLHAQPWPSQWYDAADEFGMLLIWESAAWCLSPNYALTRDEFWRNLREHIAAQMAEHRNHPSVVIWSAENELLHCGGDQVPGTEQRLGELADFMRGLDPTRPVMFDGDEDPAGKADIINLHYPHEFPEWRLWPETAYWFDQTTVTGGYPRREWRWDRRKPLYLGEFLWVPDSEVNAASLFFGDQAYPDVEAHHRLAKARAWEMQIIAARDAGLAGLCPWNLWETGNLPNPGYEAHRRAYQPIAVFPADLSTRFFAGEQVPRVLSVLNDSGARQELELRWRLRPDRPEHGAWEANGSRRLTLETAGRQRVGIALEAPRIADPVVPATFSLELWTGDRRVFSESHAWKLYRRQELSGPVPGALRRVALYDPKGDTRRILDQLAISYQIFDEKNATQVLRGASVIVIGKGALEAPAPGRIVVGEENSFLDELLRFVEAGGRAVVFEQEAYPGTFPPAALSQQDSTMAFIRYAEHPALRGLESADLAHWRPDGIVARREIVKPERGGFLAVVDSGGAAGLATAGLAELHVGAGEVLLCQLEVTPKHGVDPVATLLLRNVLAWAGETGGERALTGVVADGRALSVLEGIGLQFERIRDPAARADLSRYGQLLISDAKWALAGAARLRQFVRSGGRVVFHGIAPEVAHGLGELVGERLIVKPGGDGRIAAAARTGVGAALNNQDLAWFGPSVSPNAAPGLSPEIAAFVLERPHWEVAPRTHLEIEEMQIACPAMDRPDGGQTVALYTNGEAAARVTIRRPGLSVVVIRARGTPAEGAYPRIAILIDDMPIGSVAPASDEWQTLATLVNLPQGEHTLRIGFVNDLQTATEDRNLWLDWVEWAPVELDATNLTFHTDPGVLVSARAGRGLWVIDQVGWDAPSQNEDKGARYLATMLTSLGCRFDHEAGQTVEARLMTVRDAQLWQETSEGISFATNGTLETDVEFASSGRYGLAVRAAGTPMAGVYPLIEVLLDGRRIGEVQLTSGNWRSYRLTLRASAGVHRLTLAYVNDAWQPPEDRNLAVGRITIWKERD